MNNALSKIVEQIKLNAEAEIKRLRAENELQCSAIIEHSNKLVAKEKAKLNERVELFKQNLNFKADSENLVLKNKKLLAAKQNVMLLVKKKVVEALCSNEANRASYFNFMERLIELNLPTPGVSCVLFYGQLDYLQFLNNLKFKPDDVLKIEKASAFDRGALISCADFDVNLEVCQVVSNHILKLEPEILKILTQAHEIRGPVL